ncbi:MAG: sigma-70 family RNA polymerase sigma factor [Bacteroides sp.]|nr:sigma-70 family RNA polymerase sigma factor [Bacteroides sp.]MCM1412793.1 sigma-70 family RNA polymerase sigma factor [Bacteroides sp.]MCM1470913.1 sigma-70 family RNA polymerase sigma factor [Bacteroides sp.]
MNADEFKTTVKSLSDAMYRTAFHIMRDRDDALDAVQDTLMTLWVNRHRLEAADNRRSYCIIAVRNQCISTLRSRHTVTPIDDTPDISDESSMPDRIAARDSIDLLRQIITCLPKGQQKVMELASFSQLSNDEIAEATGLSPTNIRTILSRARKKVKHLFIINSSPR